MMLRIRPALVIEIVQQGRLAPQFFIRALLSSVSPNARLDGQRMLAQIFALRVFTQQFPRFVPVRQAPHFQSSILKSTPAYQIWTRFALPDRKNCLLTSRGLES